MQDKSFGYLRKYTTMSLKINVQKKILKIYFDVIAYNNKEK